MKKVLALSVVLAVFAMAETSYGMGRILVYKGTIKASNMVFDVNDTNNFVPLSIQGYWVVRVSYFGPYASVTDSNAAIYDKKKDWIKIIPEAVTIDPCDPCRIEILSFSATDADGYFFFNVAGKGKLTKDSNDPTTPKSYIATSMNGTGFISNYDFFAPDQTYSGPILVTLTLDPKLTLEANSKNYDVNETLNNIVDAFPRGTWHIWPYIPASP
ncbi:MAG: hypothetical protein ABSB11_07965 [Sedimentisphaerales bacterium]|jgi:hypothetical protein